MTVDVRGEIGLPSVPTSRATRVTSAAKERPEAEVGGSDHHETIRSGSAPQTSPAWPLS